MPKNTAVSSRFAQVLFEVAQEQSLLDTIEKDLKVFYELIQQEEMLRQALLNPSVKRHALVKVVEDLSKTLSLSDLTKGFLMSAAFRRSLKYFDDIYSEFMRLLKRSRGHLDVAVTTARPLTSDQAKKLRDVLKKDTGMQIDIHAEIDADLIGGMLVEVGSYLLDSSVRTQLRNLQQAMERLG